MSLKQKITKLHIPEVCHTIMLPSIYVGIKKRFYFNYIVNMMCTDESD